MTQNYYYLNYIVIYNSTQKLFYRKIIKNENIYDSILNDVYHFGS
jgi:hypothetical protein